MLGQRIGLLVVTIMLVAGILSAFMNNIGVAALMLPVVMGIVFLASLLLLIGNILSDMLVAMVDPRVRFH